MTDIAYALVAGGPLQLTVGSERVTVPLLDDVQIRRDLRTDGDRVRLELQLTWSAGAS